MAYVAEGLTNHCSLTQHKFHDFYKIDTSRIQLHLCVDKIRRKGGTGGRGVEDEINRCSLVQVNSSLSNIAMVCVSGY